MGPHGPMGPRGPMGPHGLIMLASSINGTNEKVPYLNLYIYSFLCIRIWPSRFIYSIVLFNNLWLGGSWRAKACSSKTKHNHSDPRPDCCLSWTWCSFQSTYFFQICDDYYFVLWHGILTIITVARLCLFVLTRQATCNVFAVCKIECCVYENTNFNGLLQVQMEDFEPSQSMIPLRAETKYNNTSYPPTGARCVLMNLPKRRLHCMLATCEYMLKPSQNCCEAYIMQKVRPTHRSAGTYSLYVLQLMWSAKHALHLLEH